MVRAGRAGYATMHNSAAHKSHHEHNDERTHLYGAYDIAGQYLDDPDEPTPTRLTLREQQKFRSGLNIQVINKEREEFFSLVSSGNVKEVHKFIQLRITFNINCHDSDSRTALTNAVRAENFEMVQCLLKYEHAIMGDALLHAVNKGNLKLVQYLLNSRLPSGKLRIHEENKSYSADFAPHMTPLILAAHLGHQDIIRSLLLKGHTIVKLHSPTCFCKEQCLYRKHGETLDECHARLDTYKALASPLYICHTSTDPILTAFLLAKEIRDVAKKERAFNNVYTELARQCSKLAVQILNQCRTSTEVKMILERKEGNRRCMQDPRWRFSRIGLAVELGEKEFIAHNACQQVLRTAWLEGWQTWNKMSYLAKFSRLIGRILLLPILALIYIIVPSSKFYKAWRTPLNKYFCFVASYATFLVLLMVQSELDKNNKKRGPPDTGAEFAIFLYIVGWTVKAVRTMWIYGIRLYVAQKWNVYDTFTLLFFNSAAIFWIWSASVSTDINLPREKWNQFEPTLLAEVCYAIACTMAVGKLLYFFHIGEEFGPLLVTLSRMTEDIMHFLWLFVITMVAFSIGLFQIYHHYKDNTRTYASGNTQTQMAAFNTIMDALQTLYWALYGYSPPQMAEVVVPDTYDNSTGTLKTKHHYHGVTEAVGSLLFILYYIIAIIVLVNLLVAMWANSFSKVAERSDMEWKYSRTKVWMIFFQKGETLPPPFNLLPNFRSLCKKPEKPDPVDDEAYVELMHKLIRRYLSKQSQGDDGKNKLKEEVEGLSKIVKQLQEDMAKSLQKWEAVLSNNDNSSTSTITRTSTH